MLLTSYPKSTALVAGCNHAVTPLHAVTHAHTCSNNTKVIHRENSLVEVFAAGAQLMGLASLE